MREDEWYDTRGLLATVAGLAADYIQGRGQALVVGDLSEDVLRERLRTYNFQLGRKAGEVASDLLEMLGSSSVRCDHPRYFGLFNPPALAPAIAGDLIAAVANPQLAVWAHSPAAAEVERTLVNFFGRLVWSVDEAAGTFTSGGSEANHTALLSALATRYPEWAEHGVPSGGKRPTIYCSAEAHLAWIKIARACGLGSNSVRLVATSDGLRLTGPDLAAAIAGDDGRDPVLAVATVGTTAHGSIDDIAGIAAVGRASRCHIHVDAAWAGGALVDFSHRALFAGIELADSVTIDPHKWLSVPMGAGLYLARGWDGVAGAFQVSTGYMPSASSSRHDAYIHSLQWSRRLIGAKLFMALATLGVDGYSKIISKQFALADLLRKRLLAEGWQVLNDTKLPLVCFAPQDATDDQVRMIENIIVSSGRAWISSVQLRGQLALRACITSFETDEEDIEALVSGLHQARLGDGAGD